MSHIKSMHLFAEGGCSANIVCEDGITVDIEIPQEALDGKSMDERYKIITEKANRYLACVNAAEPVAITSTPATAEDYYISLNTPESKKVLKKWNLDYLTMECKFSWTATSKEFKEAWTAKYNEHGPIVD